MMHAFFDIYTCICDGCDQKNSSYLLAGNGHGEPWLAAAYAIEQADKTVFDDDHQTHDSCGYECITKHPILGLTLGLDFNREVAVATTIQEGADLPPDFDLRRLGIDFKEMWEALQECREIKAAKSRSEQQDRQLMKSNTWLKVYWNVESTTELNKKSGYDAV